MTRVTPNCGDERNTRASSKGKEKEIVRNVKKRGVDRAMVIGLSPTIFGEWVKGVTSVNEKPKRKF